MGCKEKYTNPCALEPQQGRKDWIFFMRMDTFERKKGQGINPFTTREKGEEERVDLIKDTLIILNQLR